MVGTSSKLLSSRPRLIFVKYRCVGAQALTGKDQFCAQVADAYTLAPLGKKEERMPAYSP